MTEYLSPDDIEEIYRTTARKLERSVSPVDSRGLNEAAWSAAANTIDVDLLPNLEDKAATLLRGLACEHCPFADLNLVVAWQATLVFLERNSPGVLDRSGSLTVDEREEFVESVAAGLDEHDIAEWIRTRLL